jgi:hypothetical protein
MTFSCIVIYCIVLHFVLNLQIVEKYFIYTNIHLLIPMYAAVNSSTPFFDPILTFFYLFIAGKFWILILIHAY